MCIRDSFYTKVHLPYSKINLCKNLVRKNYYRFLEELRTTEILDAAIANAAILGDIFPVMAIGIINVL